MEHFKRYYKPMILLTAICLATYLTNYLPEEIFLNMTKEDGIFEYLTAILFFLTAVAFSLLFINNKYFKSPKERQFYYIFRRRYVFLIMAIIFLFGAGGVVGGGPGSPRGDVAGLEAIGEDLRLEGKAVAELDLGALPHTLAAEVDRVFAEFAA